MKRRRIQLGMDDAGHRGEASTAVAEARVRLGHFAHTTSCGDRATALRAAAETLAEANAHQLSIERKTANDKQRRQHLAELNAVYQRAWAQFRRRCTRSK